jgi:hypothetical protein
MTIAPFLARDSLQREDAVGARELAEAQCHHSGFRCHQTILTSAADFDLCTKRHAETASPVGVHTAATG